MVLGWLAFRAGLESEETSPAIVGDERLKDTAPEAAGTGMEPRPATPPPAHSEAPATEAPATEAPAAEAPAAEQADGEAGAIAAPAVEPNPDEDPLDDVLYTPDGDGIPQAVHDHLGEMKDCYEGWLAANPGLEGKIVLGFVIEQDPEDHDAGQVRDLSVNESTVDHLMLEGCIGSVFEGLAFEAPSEDVHVTGYPLILSTGDPD